MPDKESPELRPAGKSLPVTAITTAALLLALVFTGIFSYLYGWRWLDSDHSSEMVLGKLLAAENVLVSTKWLYGNEIRLVCQTIFIMPLFKLLGRYGDWALIRSFVIVLNNLVLVLSYVFMMKQIKVKTKWILISSFFLVIPLSFDYWKIMTFGGFYVFFAAQLFCCLGLFVKLIPRAGTVKTVPADFVLFTALSFVLGVQGIRSLLNIHIPLLLACIYMSRMAQKKKLILYLGCYAFAVSCAGYLVNCLLHFWYSFESFGGMDLENAANFFPKLGLSLMGLAGYFGFTGGVPLLSARGFFGIAAITGTFILLRTVYKTIRHAGLEGERQFMPVFFAASALFNIFVFAVGNVSVTARYFIPFMILYIPLTAILFEHAEKAYGSLKRAVIIFGIALFILGQGCLTFQSLAVKDLNSPRKDYIQYLLDNRLDYGFATFWNANVTTELSDGKIELAGLVAARGSSGGNQFRPGDWLMPVKFLDPLYYRGESFLLLAREEWDFVKNRGRTFAGLKPDYEDDNFMVIKYPSAEIIHREVLGR